MILKLMHDGNIKIKPQEVPEDVTNIKISFEYEKGTNHLRTRTCFAGKFYEGSNLTILMNLTDLYSFLNTPNISVDLFNKDGSFFKSYSIVVAPKTYIGFNVSNKYPNMVKYIEKLEAENAELKAKGELI